MLVFLSVCLLAGLVSGENHRYAAENAEVYDFVGETRDLKAKKWHLPTYSKSQVPSKKYQPAQWSNKSIYSTNKFISNQKRSLKPKVYESYASHGSVSTKIPVVSKKAPVISKKQWIPATKSKYVPVQSKGRWLNGKKSYTTYSKKAYVPYKYAAPLSKNLSQIQYNQHSEPSKWNSKHTNSYGKRWLKAKKQYNSYSKNSYAATAKYSAPITKKLPVQHYNKHAELEWSSKRPVEFSMGKRWLKAKKQYNSYSKTSVPTTKYSTPLSKELPVQHYSKHAELEWSSKRPVELSKRKRWLKAKKRYNSYSKTSVPTTKNSAPLSKELPVQHYSKHAEPRWTSKRPVELSKGKRWLKAKKRYNTYSKTSVPTTKYNAPLAKELPVQHYSKHAEPRWTSKRPVSDGERWLKAKKGYNTYSYNSYTKNSYVPTAKYSKNLPVQNYNKQVVPEWNSKQSVAISKGKRWLKAKKRYNTYSKKSYTPVSYSPLQSKSLTAPHTKQIDYKSSNGNIWLLQSSKKPRISYSKVSYSPKKQWVPVQSKKTYSHPAYSKRGLKAKRQNKKYVQNFIPSSKAVFSWPSKTINNGKRWLKSVSNKWLEQKKGGSTYSKANLYLPTKKAVYQTRKTELPSSGEYRYGKRWLVDEE